MSQGTKRKELPKTYQPKEAEQKWYRWWVEKGYFTPTRDPDKKPFTIVIPPPNVTGNLHIGHALNNTLQDILIRFKRMQGYSALYLPGMDHAGIATQARVEAMLRKEGLTRYDLGREKFLEKVWEWKEKYAAIIREQWEKIGVSVDYTRERFTMDEGLSRAVREVFVRLYEKGLIYRGKYIINWDPVAKTALSDIEVIHKEVQGKLYHLRYPLKDGSGYIEVATTRPETMLGDTAVAVHPEDERYAHLVGKTVLLPIVGREIPIIADEYVDREFGSGAVKVTPAHDPNDFEMGLRHNLEAIVVMDESARMNENAGKYQGLDRYECRRQIVEDLTEMGVCFKVEDHLHAVGHSERSGAVVEPYLSTQWFVRMKPLAERAIQEAHMDDELPADSEHVAVQFVPERFKKIYLNWIENVHDWCISRQLWWGHRIPAWYCDDCGEMTVSRDEVTVCPTCGGKNLHQDEDVLDTWFSSALWPFTTLGWPEETEDFQYFYPTDVLLTGYDIIYFWVARMIFTALEFTGKNPFRTVIITGLIRDAEGRKMSKSLGNGVDPLEVIDKYGTDAMRFMLSTGITPGQDSRFRWERVEAARNFANKIWNASRFVLMNLEDYREDHLDVPTEGLDATDRWILHRLNETIESVTKNLETYEYGEAGRALYDFVWDEFCDWYIELAKPALYGEDKAKKETRRRVLRYTLDQILRLLHPFMPFITEEIWQALPHEGESIVIAPWPTVRPEFHAPSAVEEMKTFMEIVRQVRNIRAEMNVSPGKRIEAIIHTDDERIKAGLEKNREMLSRLLQADHLVIETAMKKPEKAVSAVFKGGEVFLPLAGLIDIDQELERLERELKRLNDEVERVERKLSNPQFVEKAPAHVVEEERAKARDYQDKREKVLSRLQELQELNRS